MKPFDELTDDELIELSDAQIQRYIDLRCAEGGVPLLPPAPQPPDFLEPQPDLPIFGFAGLYFTDKGVALAVLKAVNEAPSRMNLEYMKKDRWSFDYNKPIAVPALEPEELKDTMVFSQRAGAEYAAVNVAAEAEKSNYDQLKREFDEIAAKRTSIEIPIRDRIAEAAKRSRRRERLRGEYARYLELAEGNPQVAANFLAAAHADAKDLVPQFFDPLSRELEQFDPAEPIPDPAFP